MDERDVQRFWEAHPCGDDQAGGLTNTGAADYEQFFQRYDAFRYRQHAHLLTCLDAVRFEGQEVLEIGLGQGADSEQIIRRGARWSGLDLTHESVARVRARLTLRSLPYQALKQGSALDIPFPDNHFDLVFSHGVLHHIPEIRRAQSEIARVLKPGGTLIAMLYAKWSLNYLVSIAVIRRLGLCVLCGAGIRAGGIYGEHLRNVAKVGFRKYLRLETFTHYNTDGPLNPYAVVYDIPRVRRDFPDFTLDKTYKRFMHAPPLPVRRLPLERVLGWHLWVHLRPKK